MIDPASVPEVTSDENLARFVLQRSHIRKSNDTIKPDAFIPHPHRELSVPRHLLATEDELWSVGRAVAAVTGKTLHGRGDIRAGVCLAQQLMVNARPTQGDAFDDDRSFSTD
jgi:hypothetical protein